MVTVMTLCASTTTLAEIGLDAQQRVWQWQGNDLPQLVNAVPKAIRVISRDNRYFVLDENGQVWAWGNNEAGQLGLGHFKPVNTPQKISIAAKIKDLAAGTYHTLAVDDNGQLWVWGANPRGQLGISPASSLTLVTSPTQLPASFRATQVAAETTQSLAKDGEGNIWQWGNVDAGQQPKPTTLKKAQWPAQTTPQVRLMSGRVTSATGKGIVQAEIMVNGKVCAVSQADGNYLCAVPAAVAGQMSARANNLVFSKSIKLPVTADLDKANWIAEAPTETVRNDAKTSTPLKSMPALQANTAATPSLRTEAPRKSSATLSGWVRTGTGSGSGLSGAQVQGKGANCTSTDETGRFTCQVAIGWSGTLSVTKPGYRFAPSSVAVSSIQDDDPEVQNFRAYYEPR